MQGWIKAYRSICDHWLWQDKPFAKGQAWEDILYHVNHRAGKTIFDGRLIDVEQGEDVTSIRKLCERWGWKSNTKVKNFLKLLEKEKMISLEKSDSQKTVIKVLNYAKYQKSDQCKRDSETSIERQSSDSETSTEHTNKNVKNIKNIKNEEKERNITTTSITGLREKFDWSSFSERELSEVYPFGRCNGLNLTVAEVELLYQTIPDAYVERYLIKVQNYSCNDVFETIVAWALQDGVIDFSKATG